MSFWLSRIFQLSPAACAACSTLLIAFALSGISAQAEELPLPTKITITQVYPDDELSNHYLHLLTLAMDKTTAQYGPYKIVQNPHHGGIERDRAMLIAGDGIDLMWASVTRERQEKMRVIPVDLLKGLNNYRLLLIRKEEQQRFVNVKTLADLRKFSLGTGVHWTDGRIMQHNGFDPKMSLSMPGLFKMLAAKRFDFISRGAHEISTDLRIYPDYGFAIENSLLLKYSSPLQYCFFVNKDNQKLAERLEAGLTLAKADGSFDRLSNQLPGLREGEALIRQANRQLIEIRNDINNNGNN